MLPVSAELSGTVCVVSDCGTGLWQWPSWATLCSTTYVDHTSCEDPAAPTNVDV